MAKKAVIVCILVLTVLVCFVFSAGAEGGAAALSDKTASAAFEPLFSESKDGRILLREPEISLFKGQQAQIKFNATGEGVFSKGFTYESSDPDVARVAEHGIVTAAGPGECFITLTSNAKPDVWAKVKVSVIKPVKSITLSGDTWLRTGESTKISADIEPDDAEIKDIEWKSSNPEYASVDNDGVVTGMKRGNVTISATAKDGSNARGTIRVSVTQPVTGVRMELKAPYFRVGVGEMRKAEATVLPRYASKQDMTWTSSDENIATVVGDRNEVKVYAHAWGQCTVTGKTDDGGFETSFDVLGGRPSQSVQVNNRRMHDREPAFSLDNVSNITLNGITVQIRAFDKDGNPLAIAEGEDPTVLNASWSGELAPGESVQYNELKYGKHAFDKVHVDHYLVAVTGIRSDEGYLSSMGRISHRYDFPEEEQNWRKCK